MIRGIPHCAEIKLSCGTAINVISWGNHLAPACLLIHGLDNNAHIWDNLATTLQQNFQVFAIDIRGHGESDWTNRNCYTLDTLLNDIEQIRAYLSLTDFSIIGHSLGGIIAAHYTAQNLEFIQQSPLTTRPAH